jgi:hypothetical protein
MAKLIVVSLSLQPVLSLAVRYNLSPDETAHKLSGMFILLEQGTVMLKRAACSMLNDDV